MSDQPQPEVFTRAFKVKGSIVTGCLTLLLFVIPFGGGLALSWWIGKHYGEAAGALTFVGVLALWFATNYLAHQTVFLYGNARMRRDLAAAIERRTGHDPDSGRSWFVGWAPGRSLNPQGGGHGPRHRVPDAHP
jgi:apolipoprotein N-acyltransferase